MNEIVHCSKGYAELTPRDIFCLGLFESSKIQCLAELKISGYSRNHWDYLIKLRLLPGYDVNSLMSNAEFVPIRIL